MPAAPLFKAEKTKLGWPPGLRQPLRHWLLFDDKSFHSLRQGFILRTLVKRRRAMLASNPIEE